MVEIHVGYNVRKRGRNRTRRRHSGKTKIGETRKEMALVKESGSRKEGVNVHAGIHPHAEAHNRPD